MSTPTTKPPKIAYCTNVHAGPTLAEARANLESYALDVRSRVRPNRELGVGLWLAASAARELLESDGALDELAGWLRDNRLSPLTMNGFPYGDFHSEVVKHNVYRPTWSDPERLEYTLQLIEILDGLLPKGEEGSISTLPIAWGKPGPSGRELGAAAAALLKVADHLAELEAERGRLIYLCIEPEPGCVLDVAGDMVEFFEHRLLPSGSEDHVRRHLRVCHDVCHSVVMAESQAEVLQEYRRAGIQVGKVQVSSAVVLPLDELQRPERSEALDQLAGFAEDRYLHQTTIETNHDSRPQFYEDLPLALAAAREADELSGTWRVHFHVPVYLESFGRLQTSQDAILECLRVCREHHPDLTHFEVETYAWGVLPTELQQPSLASGIAEELRWFEGELKRSAK